MTRREEIEEDILKNSNGFWNSFSQGRYAHACGRKRDENPWHHNPSHVNYADWARGWDEEFNLAGAERLMTAIEGTTDEH